ncbi:MAG: helix-turn-helix domain-containing protein [Mycobacterium sp.]
MTEMRRSRATVDPATSTTPIAETDYTATPPGASEVSVQLRQNRAVEHPHDPGHWCLGLDGKWRPNRRFDTASRDRNIVGLRATGWSMRDIAAEMGCSVGTVHRVISGWVER